MTAEVSREKLAELARDLEEAIRLAREVADVLATLAVPVETIATGETRGESTENQKAISPELEEAVKRAAEERKGERITLEVHEVLEKTARELFGPGAKDPTRRYWALYHWSKDGKMRKLGQIPIPTDPAKVSPRSLAARYVARYGHLPRPGDRVELRRGEDGWLELVL